MGKNKRRRDKQRTRKEQDLNCNKFQEEEKCILENTVSRRKIADISETEVIRDRTKCKDEGVQGNVHFLSDQFLSLLSPKDIHLGSPIIQSSDETPPLLLNESDEIFETKSRNTERRDYYFHYLCHVCKTIPKHFEKLSCSKCKLVTYCSTKHQREHWPSHADVCQVLAEIMSSINFENITPEDFRTIRLNLIARIERVITRKLEKWERELILYYNHCYACYEKDSSFLQSCSVCKHISFCKSHPIKDNHSQYCSSLVLYREIALRLLRNDLVSISFPETFSVHFNQTCMKSFCAENTGEELEAVYLSELATSPLSVLWTLKCVFQSHQNVPERLCIHVIGAENDFELNVVEKWEIFLSHYLPCRELILVFIGPELFSDNYDKYQSCDECEDDKRKVLMNFHSNTLYHEYVLSSQFVNPDIICSFNPGFYRTTGFDNKDTWQKTIVSILEQNVPVLTTAYTEEEIMKDVQRVENQSKLMFLQTPSRNLFSSLKPFLSFVYDEVTPVIFKNYYFTIFKPA